MRVWSAGPQHVRLALLGQFGESDLIRNGADLWAWSSKNNAATHVTLPADRHPPGRRHPGPGRRATTPQQPADQALKAIDPTTAVSTDPTAVVAGRPAYQLVLEPRDRATLVGSVRIAIDGATHIPTRVQVFAKGASSPAFEVGFTSFDPSTPSRSVFGFNPPPGRQGHRAQPARDRAGTAHRRPATGPRRRGDAAVAARRRLRVDLGPGRLVRRDTPARRRQRPARHPGCRP